jgi:hypothetical protein
LALLAWHAVGAHAAAVYLGEYRGEYSFHFSQEGLQPGVEYSDEADEDFSWDVHFGDSGGSQVSEASISASGIDRFARAGDVEARADVTCTVAQDPAPVLAPQYFDVEPGSTAGTVDVRAIIPIFTGAAGQVTLAPASDEVCAGLEATGAAINCDPFGCGWECVSFAANPAFDGSWEIALRDVPVRSFPRSFEASEKSSPCMEPAVAYAATRSLKATLSVLVRAPAPKASHKRRHARAVHSAGR